MNNKDNNCFLLIGKSGSGKSTLSKILTGNKDIKISSGLISCTNKTNQYQGEIDNFKFTIIDTIGLNDSFGNDGNYILELRDFLSNKNLKIKGIFIIIDFHDSRFGKCELESIKRVIDLIPIDNIWQYISIIYTHYYTDKWHKLEDKKKELLNDLEKIFTSEIFDYSIKQKAILFNDFNSIKIIFVDVNEDFSTLNDIKEIVNLMKKSEKFPPLFSDCEKIEENNIDLVEIDPNNSKKGILYKCDLNIYKYYNQSKELIKELKTIKSKKKIKDFERANKKIKKICIGGAFSSMFGIVLSGAIGTIFPPAAFGIFPFMGLGFGSLFVAIGKEAYDFISEVYFFFPDIKEDGYEDFSKIINK